MNDDSQPDDEVKRNLFTRVTGGIDFQRLFEQLIPAIIVGAFVAFANAKVTESEVGELTKKIDATTADTRVQQAQLAAQAVMSAAQQERLTAIAEKMTSYIGQQTAINANINDRLTYIERDHSSQPNGMMRR